MIIRRAVSADKERIGQLYRELEEDAVFYQPEHFILSDGISRQIDDIINSGDQAIFVSQDDDG